MTEIIAKVNTANNIGASVNNSGSSFSGLLNSTTNVRAKVLPTSVGTTGPKSRVTPNNEFLITNYAVNTSNIRIQDIFDVDPTELSDGSVLLYNGNREIWETTPLMDNNNTIINGGNF